MPTGLYGKASPPADTVIKLTDTAVATGKRLVATIAACNTTDYVAEISWAASTAATAAGVLSTEWKASGSPLKAHGEYERTHQILVEGENVFVKSSIAGVNFDVRGYEGGA